MRALEFRDDDVAYQAWLANNPDGYVINIARSHKATAARFHRSYCRTINHQNPRGGPWTGPYVKVCAQQLTELEQWASEHVGDAIPLCRACHPTREPKPHSSVEQTEQESAPPNRGHSYIHGPAADRVAVEAWADDYIRFERRPAWQDHLRDEIRRRCRQLEPPAGQMLHAKFFGPKLANADVENLVLYNIDSFRIAGRNGIRFEHGGNPPPTPDGVAYRFGYCYSLAPRSDIFTHWRQGRRLASFDWTDLGAFGGEKKLAQVWLALSRADATGLGPAAAETPFGVRVQVRPPHGQHPVWGGLVKGIFDGVICAFQAHLDTSVLPEVAARLAEMLPADPAEIEGRLLDQRRTVLGAKRRLVSPYREGVKWDPSDHLCVAGELLAAEPVDDHWSISGELVELSR